eukprot:CAMPEP_0185778316 /NCGR_PEP_ID=MMETSP1174-20130828/92146_1 /TAXON_ID=35687 /ORGANISM="Dictyocha speculum, Strain CCMP1381" /LENGTH=48 /DNA_ID= /DNA_START= /DNA_END= /DNA_ORIENTATION=
MPEMGKGGCRKTHPRGGWKSYSVLLPMVAYLQQAGLASVKFLDVAEMF